MLTVTRTYAQDHHIGVGNSINGASCINVANFADTMSVVVASGIDGVSGVCVA
jgi:hypothetical protein